MPPPDYPMLDFGRRTWIAVTLLLLLGLVLRAAAPGLQVVGPLTSTDTERAEFMVAIGNGVMCKVNDEAIFKRQVEPLIGQQVVLTLVAE